jgi:hypothetical protein
MFRVIVFFLYWSYHGSHDKFCASCHHWLHCDIFLILMKTLQAFHFSIIPFYFIFWLWGFVLWIMFYWKQWDSNLGGRTWRLWTFHFFSFAFCIFCCGYIWSTKLAILAWEDPFFNLHFVVFVFWFADF